MERLTVDHTAGRHGRGIYLAAPDGHRVLGLIGSSAVTDDEDRTVLFLAPDYKGIMKRGLLDGLLGGLIGGNGDISPRLRNRGEGVQTVKRPPQPVRAVATPRWTPVVTVRRQPGNGGDDRYDIEAIESGLAPARFVQPANAAELAAPDCGIADRRLAVWDLTHPDGRLILRHSITVDKRWYLRTSVFDVEDPEYPLAEAVMICLARFAAWRN